MAINWITSVPKKKADDVTLKLIKMNGDVAVAITIRGRKGDMLSKNRRLALGIDGNKLYFRDDTNGYKFSQTSPENVRIQTSNAEIRDFVRERSGDYQLQKDKVNGLWYIETGVDSAFDKYK